MAADAVESHMVLGARATARNDSQNGFKINGGPGRMDLFCQLGITTLMTRFPHTQRLTLSKNWPKHDVSNSIPSGVDFRRHCLGATANRRCTSYVLR
jgi:hypothetical protein